MILDWNLSILWIPTVKFNNTESKITSKNDKKSRITIEKNGHHTLADVNENTNYFKYKGSENRLSISRIYDVNFLCEYDFSWYPFDKQHCYINITFPEYEDSFVQQLKIKQLSYTGPLHFQSFNLVSKVLTARDVSDGIVVSITLIRDLLSQIVTTYIPSLLIVIICYVSTMFDDRRWFGHIVTINVAVTFSFLYFTKFDVHFKFRLC